MMLRRAGEGRRLSVRFRPDPGHLGRSRSACRRL